MTLKERVISKEINRLMWHSGKTISTAESCSCGRLATLLSEYPGSSEYFRGGIVCYTDEMKAAYLGISGELLREKTAVCEEVAIGMVEGSIRMFGTDYAVAMTGVAGPGGATPDNPVGSIRVAFGKTNHVETFHFLTDEGRDLNVQNAVYGVMKMFLRFLKDELKKE